MDSNKKPAILFKYEKIINFVMMLSPGVNLNFVVDLGFKDQNGAKQRIFNEFEYSNEKYNNVSSLISAKINGNGYLRLDYPNPDKTNYIKTKNLPIYDYSILSLRNVINQFESRYWEALYQSKNGGWDIDTKKIIVAKCATSMTSLIEFSQSLYFSEKDNEYTPGVKFVLNEEFEFTIGINYWQAFIYYINTIDFFMWKNAVLGPYMTNLMGLSVSSIGKYSLNKTYDIETTWEAMDNNVDDGNTKTSAKSSTFNNSGSISNNSSSSIKPTTRKERIKGFFDD